MATARRIGVLFSGNGQLEGAQVEQRLPDRVNRGVGVASDIAVPGDYDGDGKTDPAVYRAATGQWIMRLSSVDYATTTTLDLGTPTDIPVPGDYDGDGVTDIAVFQPATSTWVARLSSLGLKSTTLATLGAAGDTPVSADFDGDGKADLAVFHDGLWQILASSLVIRPASICRGAGRLTFPCTERFVHSSAAGLCIDTAHFQG